MEDFMDSRSINVVILGFILIFCTYCTPSIKAETKVPSAEDRLQNALGITEGSNNTYNPATRPVNSSNVTEPTVVKIWFRLQHIYNVQEQDRSLHTNVELIQRWHDEMLTWNPEEYSGIKSIVINAGKVWTPDIIIHNSLLDTFLRFTSFFGEESELVKVKYDGTVTRKPSYLLYTMCQFDIENFPFDNHACYFFVRSVMYDIDMVRLETQKFPASLNFSYVFDSESEWDLLAMASYQLPIDEIDGEQYDTAMVTLWIKRKPLFYMINITIPSMILIILTAVSYILPIESGERVGVGLTVLLAFTVFTLVVAESVPKTSQGSPLLTSFLTLAMFSNLVVVMWTIICTRCWIRPPREQYSPGLFGRIVLKLKKYMHIHRPNSLCSCPIELWTTSPEQKEGKIAENQMLLDDSPNNNSAGVFDSKLDNAENNEPVNCNWHVILEIIDRLFFLFTLVLQLLAFFIMVVILPWHTLQKNNNIIENMDRKIFIDFTETYG